MKLRAERSELAEAVAWATRTVSSRVSLPALAGVLLEADEGRLFCRATDLEVSAEISIPVQIEQPGRVLLLGKLLSQLVAKLPDAPVDIDGTNDTVTITCGSLQYDLRAMPAEDFPTLPQPADDAPRGALKSEAFGKLVNQVARAAATDDGRPVLTGVHLEASEGMLTAAATDSYRLAVRRLAWDQAVDGKALIPARALQEAARAATEAGGAVTVALEEGQASFLYGDRVLTTRLIEGTFPNYGQLLPDSFETSVVVDRAQLMESISRVAVIAIGAANTPVKMVIGDGSIELQAANSERGAASEALPAEINGEGLQIAFNPNFLLAGLEATGTDQVRIELRDGLKPAVLKPHVTPADDGADVELEDFTYLLMPMKI